MRDDNKITAIIIEIITEQMENKLAGINISEDTNLMEDLLYDSVDIIGFIVLLEEKFQVNFDEIENLIDHIDTVGHISRLIQNMI